MVHNRGRKAMEDTLSSSRRSSFAWSAAALLTLSQSVAAMQPKLTAIDLAQSSSESKPGELDYCKKNKIAENKSGIYSEMRKKSSEINEKAVEELEIAVYEELKAEVNAEDFLNDRLPPHAYIEVMRIECVSGLPRIPAMTLLLQFRALSLIKSKTLNWRAPENLFEADYPGNSSLPRKKWENDSKTLCGILNLKKCAHKNYKERSDYERNAADLKYVVMSPAYYFGISSKLDTRSDTFISLKEGVEKIAQNLGLSSQLDEIRKSFAKLVSIFTNLSQVWIDTDIEDPKSPGLLGLYLQDLRDLRENVVSFIYHPVRNTRRIIGNTKRSIGQGWTTAVNAVSGHFGRTPASATKLLAFLSPDMRKAVDENSDSWQNGDRPNSVINKIKNAFLIFAGAPKFLKNLEPALHSPAIRIIVEHLLEATQNTKQEPIAAECFDYFVFAPELPWKTGKRGKTRKMSLEENMKFEIVDQIRNRYAWKIAHWSADAQAAAQEFQSDMIQWSSAMLPTIFGPGINCGIKCTPKCKFCPKMARDGEGHVFEARHCESRVTTAKTFYERERFALKVIEALSESKIDDHISKTMRNCLQSAKQLLNKLEYLKYSEN